MLYITFVYIVDKNRCLLYWLVYHVGYIYIYTIAVYLRMT